MSQLDGSEAGTQASFGQIGAFHYDQALRINWRSRLPRPIA